MTCLPVFGCCLCHARSAAESTSPPFVPNPHLSLPRPPSRPLHLPQAYAKLVQETKNDRLHYQLNQTDTYLATINKMVQDQRDMGEEDDDQPAPAPAPVPAPLPAALTQDTGATSVS